MYCAADVSRENPANCLLNFMKSEHAVEHDEITVKLLHTFTLVTQFKDQNSGQTSWKLSFHLSGKACQKSCPNSFIPPRVGVCSSASLCMGAMHPCLYLLSNVSKERQPVKKKKSTDNISHISSPLSVTRGALSLSCRADLYSNSQNCMLCCSNPGLLTWGTWKDVFMSAFCLSFQAKRGEECCFTTNSEVTNWIWASPRAALVNWGALIGVHLHSKELLLHGMCWGCTFHENEG